MAVHEIDRIQVEVELQIRCMIRDYVHGSSINRAFASTYPKSPSRRLSNHLHRQGLSPYNDRSGLCALVTLIPPLDIGIGAGSQSGRRPEIVEAERLLGPLFLRISHLRDVLTYGHDAFAAALAREPRFVCSVVGEDQFRRPSALEAISWRQGYALFPEIVAART